LPAASELSYTLVVERVQLGDGPEERADELAARVGFVPGKRLGESAREAG
jgi:hypothetical protein